MENPEMSMRQIKETLKRIDKDLTEFIVKRRHLFNVESYQVWSNHHQEDAPKADKNVTQV